MSASALPLEPPLSPGGSAFPPLSAPLPPSSQDAPATAPPPLPVPAPAPEPAPVAAPEPVDVPVPAAVSPEPVAAPSPPAPDARAGHAVVVRLTTGEEVQVARHADPAAAAAEATALMRYLRDGRGDWPFIAGRFVRPDAIVSIDLQ